MRSEKHVHIRASSSDIWEVLTDINSWPDWQSGVSKSELTEPLAVGATFRWKAGGLPLHSEVIQLIPEENIGWKGSTIGAHAEHHWYLESMPDGVLVRTDETMEGWLVRLVGFFSPKFLDKTLENALQELKVRCEEAVS